MIFLAWWRHQIETFSALLALCAGNSPVTGEFPAQRPVTRSFGGFFDLRLNKRLSKQSWLWWFETPSRPLWHHCNVPPRRNIDPFILMYHMCIKCFIICVRLQPTGIVHLHVLLGLLTCMSFVEIVCVLCPSGIKYLFACIWLMPIMDCIHLCTLWLSYILC